MIQKEPKEHHYTANTSLHFTTLHPTTHHYTYRHFTSSHLHFTNLSFDNPITFPIALFHLTSLK